MMPAGRFDRADLALVDPRLQRRVTNAQDLRRFAWRKKFFTSHDDLSKRCLEIHAQEYRAPQFFVEKLRHDLQCCLGLR